MKEQEASGLLCSLGIKTPFSNIPLLDAIFHYWIKYCLNSYYGSFIPLTVQNERDSQ